MPTLTIVLPETVAERLRRTVRERYASKKGAMSRIISEALEAYLTRSEAQVPAETFRAVKGSRIIAEAPSLAQLAQKLRAKNANPRDLRIISTRRIAPVAKAGFRAKPV